MNHRTDFRKSIATIAIFFTLTVCFSLVSLEVDGQQSKSAMARPQTQVREPRQYTIEQFMSTVRIGGSSFSSDEQSILFHSNKSGIFNVYSVPVTGGEPMQFTTSDKESTYAISYSYTYFSHNGKYRVTAINEDARTKIEIKDETTGKPVVLPKLPNGDITGVNISPSEKLMVFYMNGDRSPGSLYVYNFSTQKVTKLTESLSPEIDPSDLVDSQVIRYKSFDGVEIPSILYKPKNASSQQKAPALLLIHGGPGGQTRAGYSALTRCLVNHGYVVLGVNICGSSGYGKTFFTSDDGKHGREPLWDCVEAKK